MSPKDTVALVEGVVALGGGLVGATAILQVLPGEVLPVSFSSFRELLFRYALAALACLGSGMENRLRPITKNTIR